MFKGFIFDLDGTVYLGERLIPGAERMIRSAPGIRRSPR